MRRIDVVKLHSKDVVKRRRDDIHTTWMGVTKRIFSRPKNIDVGRPNSWRRGDVVMTTNFLDGINYYIVIF